ncbi:acyl carrier protein [Streptomyces sp. NPDC059166]|uniref:acyl carrier protein n=1 Tax=Streptomyces sp. NPDC059166 TaxID=3346752 RepID=UPI0036C415F8
MTDLTELQIDETLLTRLLSEHFEIDPGQVRPDATFEELELDSLAVLELVVVIEERTGLELPEEDIKLGPASTLSEAGRLLAAMVAEAREGGTAARDGVVR